MPGLGINDLWRRPSNQDVKRPNTGTPEPTPRAPGAGRPRIEFEIGGGAQIPSSRPLVPPAVQPSIHTASPGKIELAEGFRNVPAPQNLGTGMMAAFDKAPAAVLRRALDMGAPGPALSERDVLMFRGASLAAFTSAALVEGRDRQRWLDDARESMRARKAELDHFGTTAAVADGRALDMIEAEISYQMKLSGRGDLPREVLGKADKSIQLSDNYFELEKRRERLLALVEGIQFSLNSRTPEGLTPEAGRMALPTALDIAKDVRVGAKTTAPVPGIRPHLVMDQKTLDAALQLRSSLDERGFDAAREYSRIGVPTLAESLHGKGLDQALSDAIASSAGMSGASPLEASHTRDLALALNGDPLMVTHQARNMAALALKHDPKWAEYKAAAKTFIFDPSEDHMKEFVVSVATLGELDFDRIAALGWGPGSVLAAAFGGRGTAVEAQDTQELLGALPPNPAFEVEKTHGQEPQTFMLPATSPKEQPKVIQFAPSGDMVRVVSFIHGEAKLVFEGTTSDAAKTGSVNDRIAAWAKMMSSALSTPHAIDEAHSLGLLSVRPSWLYPKTPHLVDPRRQAPEIEIVRYKDPLTLDQIEMAGRREMAYVGGLGGRARDFGEML